MDETAVMEKSPEAEAETKNDEVSAEETSGSTAETSPQADDASKEQPVEEQSPPPADDKNTKKKKNKKERKDPVPEELDTKFTIRRSSKETKKYTVMMRVMAVLTVILIAIIAIGYAISYFYDKFGGFTVKINKYDMIKQGLTLSETPDYTNSLATLNADIVYDMTNISGEDLPDNIDMINGSHNGENYIAYTFYLINGGDDTITYQGELNIDKADGGVDEAIRVAVYKNGVKTVYGKTKSNGGGIEKDCDKEFESSTMVMKDKHENFKPGSKDKFTVVIWLEGNDPDCTNEIIGGTMKLSMYFEIVEDT